MLKKRLLALALCLTLAALSACGQSGGGADLLSDMNPGEDSVVIVNGYGVSQAEYVYYLAYVKAYFEGYYSQIYGSAEGLWDGDDETSVSMRQQLQEEAKRFATQTVIVRQMAQEAGLSLSTKDIESLQEEKDEAISNYETEAEWQAALKENGMNEATFDRVALNGAYYTKLEEYYTGDDGQISMDDVKESYSENYLQAKHILISTQDDSGASLSEEEIAQKLTLAQDIIQQLQDGADFDELLAQYGEDPGMEGEENADGYVFTEGDMVDEFYQGTLALEEGAFSLEPVESSYGYHIIYRLPLDTDSLDDETLTSLRTQMFQDLMTQRMEEAEVETTDLFDEITVLNVMDYLV